MRPSPATHRSHNTLSDGRQAAVAPVRSLTTRSITGALLAGLALAAIAGCGKTPPVHLAHTSISRARAQAIARSITLRSGDLREYQATEQPAVVRGRIATSGQGICSYRSRTAGSSQRLWAFASSNRLAAGSGFHVLGASSAVSIMHTAAAARRGIGRSAQAEKACLERTIRRYASQGLDIHGIVVRPLSLNVPGADASVAYQATIAVHGAPLVLYLDAIAFAYGQDLIELTTYHASAHVPRSMDQRLLDLLLTRAQAHAQ